MPFRSRAALDPVPVVVEAIVVVVGDVVVLATIVVVELVTVEV